MQYCGKGEKLEEAGSKMLKSRRRSSSLSNIAGWRRLTLEVSFSGLLVLVILAPVMESSQFLFANIAGYIRQISYATLILLVIVAKDPRQIGRMLVLPWPIVITLAWCLLSVSWSADIPLSITRLLLTGIVIWIVFATIPSIGSVRSLLIIRTTLAAALLVNLVAVFYAPRIGTHWDHLGLWRGVMSSKNHAGALCAISIIFWTFGVPPRQRWVWLAFAAAAVIFLVRTDSRTAMIMLFVSFTVAGTLYLSGPTISNILSREGDVRARQFGLSVFAIITAILIYVTFFSDVLVDYTRDPEILSRRNQLWQPLIIFYLDHPLLGSGFGGYWSGIQVNMQNYAGSWLGNVSQGHNGYLEIAIQIGLPGLLLAIFSGIAWPLGEILRKIRTRPADMPLVLGILMFCIGSNITESGFFLRDTLWQVFLMIAIAMLYDGKLKRRRSTERGRLNQAHRHTANGVSDHRHAS